MRAKHSVCFALFIIFFPLEFVYSTPVGKNSPFILAPLTKKYPLIPGVYFQAQRQWKQPAITWLWVHNDEYDAMSNTYWAYKKLGGTSLFLFNNSYPFNRNISYYIKNTGRFLLDPNRMFHLTGIKNNLTLLNYNFHQKSPKKVISYTWNHIGKKARKILQNYWSKGRPLIAIHNNRYLSIKKYRDNPKHFLLAEFEDMPTTTFVFVVNKQHYLKLKNCRINTIYQKKIQYDGSLSDFALQKNLPYINVETKINHREEQQQVLLKIAHALYPHLFKNHPLFKFNLCPESV